MAIKNASDLLVYKHTSPAQAQKTRILVKNITPFDAVGNLKLNAVYKAGGSNAPNYRYNETVTFTANTGTNVLNAIKSFLTSAGYNYTFVPSTVGTINTADGNFKYFDFISPISGDAPDIFITAGTSTPEDGAIKINILEDGQDATYTPVAFSTSASLSMTNDLRDVTTKDSNGYQENEEGLKSFEISTDGLVNFNANVNAETFVNDFRVGNTFDVKFSDRIRNIVPSPIIDDSQTYWNQGTPTSNFQLGQVDPFGGLTASKLLSTSNSDNEVFFQIPNTKLQGFYNHITFYAKGVASNTEFTIFGDAHNLEVIEGSATLTSLIGGMQQNITGLSTTQWTRFYIRYGSPQFTQSGPFSLEISPSLKGDMTNTDQLLISSFQVEQNYNLNDGYTNYQNPYDVNCYQGDATVSSISLEAGVEENATYSCTLTGTSQLFLNGLGNELLLNTQFYDSPGWQVTNGSISTSAGTCTLLGSSSSTLVALNFDGSLRSVPEKELELTYTITQNLGGILRIQQVGTLDLEIPSVVGTHTVRFLNDKPTSFSLITTALPANIKLTSVSLKLVRP